MKIPFNDPQVLEKLTAYLKKIVPEGKEVYIACIGTDRSTGDSFGPLVGTFLQRAGVPNVIGTLDDPLHAMNLSERIAQIPPDAFIIAVDAALGRVVSVGCIEIFEKPIRPGAGVGKHLPPIGHVSVQAVVNVGGFMEYFVLQNTRLNLVMKMSEVAATTISSVLPPQKRRRKRKLKFI